MNDLSKAVLEILEKNNVSKQNILETLSLIYRDMELELWETITVSPPIFYGLKDLIWYNMEHLPSGGEARGISNLRFLGTKFPNFIYCCNDNNIIELANISGLLLEIETIIQTWNKDWWFATLFTKSSEGWQGGENPSKVIIYDSRTETPTKYGYNTKYNNIFDVKGESIKKYDFDTVLCELDVPIGEFANGQILYNLLFQLRETCKRAIRNKRDIKIEFEM
jgi:hypothetical protein